MAMTCGNTLTLFHNSSQGFPVSCDQNATKRQQALRAATLAAVSFRPPRLNPAALSDVRISSHANVRSDKVLTRGTPVRTRQSPWFAMLSPGAQALRREDAIDLVAELEDTQERLRR